MDDTRESLRRGIGDFTPRPDAYRHVLERRRRKARNRRLGAFSVVALIVLAGALAVVAELRSAPAVLDNRPRPSRLPSNGAVVFAAVNLDAGGTVPADGEGMDRKDPRDLYLVLPGGEPRRILGSDQDGLDQACPAFSPDGTRLAFVEGVNRFSSNSVKLVEIDADGTPSGDPVEILGNARISGCPQWSPAGDRLAIVEYREREMRIVGLDGGSTTIPLGFPGIQSDLYAFAYAVAWSPDASALAILESKGLRGPRSLRIVPVDGGESSVVWTAGARRSPASVAWAPDGSRLAVAGRLGPVNSCCDGATPFLEIVDLRDDSRTTVPIEGDPGGDSARVIAWLSSRDRILLSLLDARSQLVDPNRSAPTETVHLEYGDASSIVVSPDQEKLLYVGYDGATYAIVTQPLDGGPAIPSSPWTFGLYTNYGDLSWQPMPAGDRSQ